MTTEAISDAGDEVDVEVEHVDEHVDYGTPDGHYILIAFGLMMITAAEVAASYIDIGPLLVPLLVVLMSIKFLVVVFWFMHLKFDNRIFTWLFFSGLLLAIFVYVAALMTFHFFIDN
jgi:cytochrome c oxidase subunit 4